MYVKRTILEAYPRVIQIGLTLLENQQRKIYNSHLIGMKGSPGKLEQEEIRTLAKTIGRSKLAIMLCPHSKNKSLEWING